MKYIDYIKYSFFVLFLTFAASVQADDVWRCIYSLDFGGNATTDPVYRTSGLTSTEGSSSLDFAEVADISTIYCIGKYPKDNLNSWIMGSDHTYPNDNTRGYFVMLNCATSCQEGVTIPNCLNYPEQYIYDKTLSGNLCTGVTFKFSVYVCNLNPNDASSQGSFITLGIYDDANNQLWQRDAVQIPVSGSSSSLSWQEVSGEFTIPESADISALHFKIYPMTGDQPGAETNGYDFGLDDINIYISQPDLSFSHSEYLYNSPATLSASLTGTKFFADMNDVLYRWEYSADGTSGWSTLYSGKYSDSNTFNYTIDKFNKNDNTGKGNGYYRLTLATSEANFAEDAVCCVRDTMQIHETKNKVNMLLCEGGSETLDGSTFTDADEGKALITTPNDFDVTVSVLHKKEVKDTTVICVGQEYLGTTYTTTQITLLSTVPTSSIRTNYSGETCDSIVTKNYVKVTDGEYVLKSVDNICKGQKSSATGDTYNTAGDFRDTTDVGCLHNIQPVHVGETYDLSIDKTICEGETYSGTVYSKSGDYDLPSTTYKTVKEGCDSVVVVSLHVTSHTEGSLPDVEVCQSTAGEGKTAYSFDGTNYKNTTKKDLVLDLESHSTSVMTGCDSITSVHVTIHPIIHDTLDTLICRDQILFGQEYTTAGTYYKDFSYTSYLGCDSTVTWQIEVLDIQLKLRAEFGASSICEGSSATLIVDLIPSNVPLTWEPALSSRNPLRPTVMPDASTTYVAHAENSAGCHATDSITISVYPVPTLVIDSIYQQDRKFDFSVSGGTEPYTYMIGTRDVTPVGNTVSELTYGTQEFRVIDSVGCTAIDTFSLSPLPVNPSTMLSPNGDGINDTWQIENIDVYPKATVRIYSRYGALLYEKTSYDNTNAWDGTYLGEKMPSTDYWYEIDIDDIDKQYVGHFTLIR